MLRPPVPHDFNGQFPILPREQLDLLKVQIYAPAPVHCANNLSEDLRFAARAREPLEELRWPNPSESDVPPDIFFLVHFAVRI